MKSLGLFFIVGQINLGPIGGCFREIVFCSVKGGNFYTDELRKWWGFSFQNDQK